MELMLDTTSTVHHVRGLQLVCVWGTLVPYLADTVNSSVERGSAEYFWHVLKTYFWTSFKSNPQMKRNRISRDCQVLWTDHRAFAQKRFPDGFCVPRQDTQSKLQISPGTPTQQSVSSSDVSLTTLNAACENKIGAKLKKTILFQGWKSPNFSDRNFGTFDIQTRKMNLFTGLKKLPEFSAGSISWPEKLTFFRGWNSLHYSKPNLCYFDIWNYRTMANFPGKCQYFGNYAVSHKSIHTWNRQREYILLRSIIQGTGRCRGRATQMKKGKCWWVMKYSS